MKAASYLVMVAAVAVVRVVWFRKASRSERAPRFDRWQQSIQMDRPRNYAREVDPAGKLAKESQRQRPEEGRN